MISRYDDRIVVINRHERYKQLLDDRGVNLIRQFNSPQLRFPTESEMATLTIINHFWSVGDRYYKLADKHYGDSRLWWVIAWFNRKPTESHLQLGDLLYIPLPLERVLGFMDV